MYRNLFVVKSKWIICCCFFDNQSTQINILTTQIVKPAAAAATELIERLEIKWWKVFTEE